MPFVNPIPPIHYFGCIASWLRCNGEHGGQAWQHGDVVFSETFPEEPHVRHLLAPGVSCYTVGADPELIFEEGGPDDIYPIFCVVWGCSPATEPALTMPPPMLRAVPENWAPDGKNGFDSEDPIVWPT